MSSFQKVVSSWLVARIKLAATLEGREIEALNYKTPLYIPQEEYDSGVADGYISSTCPGTPTPKFVSEYSAAITHFGIIK